MFFGRPPRFRNTTQVKHLVLTGLIDDISVGNAYASEAELAAMAEAFHAPYPSIKVDTEPEITEDERIALFDNLHSYRGDRSDYVLRSTMTRVYYKDRPFQLIQREILFEAMS